MPLQTRAARWQRSVLLAGGLLTIAAAALLITGLLSSSSPATNSTAIIFLNNATPQPGSSPAAPSVSATPHATLLPPGTVRNGAIVVDGANPAPFSLPAGAKPATLSAVTGPAAPRGSLDNLSVGAWLLIWPLLLAGSLLAVAALTPRLVLLARAPR